MRRDEDNVPANEGSWRAGVGWGAESASADSENLAADWRRRSCDTNIQRTAAIAVARDAEKATQVHNSSTSSVPIADNNDPSSPNSASDGFNPPLEVRVVALSLWVRVAFPAKSSPSLSLSCFSEKVPSNPQNDISTVTHTPRELALADVASVDIEKAELAARGAFQKDSRAENASPRKATDMVRVLRDVSFTAFPGEVLAVLGPSGSGKTSLVTAVAGRINTTGGGYALEGTAEFLEREFLFLGDGAEKSKSKQTQTRTQTRTPVQPKHRLGRRVGFVTQDDCLFPSLTVRETVQYAAALRLPDLVGESTRNARSRKRSVADGALKSLSLEACKNTIIGGVFSFPRGVSGGERKRVSVAVELLTKPSVLLLDEPTSGLDSTVANKLVAMLSRLAKGDDTPAATSTTPASRTNQRTVIMTIHQPSQRVVTSFDVTLFLAKGERAYYGSARGIFPYFRNELNLNPPWGTNPAEFALDVCNGNVDGFGVETGVDGGQVVENVLAASAARTARIGDDGAEEGTLSSKDAYEGTSTGTTGGVTTTHASSPSPPPPDNRKFATTWFRQITVLSKRALSARRGAFFDALKISQILFVAFLVGALWWRRGTEVGLDSVGDLSGVLFFELLFLSFLTLFNSLFTFPDEKAVALKERQSGVIRVSSYFVARTAVDVPIDLFPPTLFVPIVYWMAGLRGTFSAFIQHLLVVYLVTLVASSLGLFIGCVSPNPKQAQTIASVSMLAVMLTGGFYFDKTPAWLDWTKETSFINHAYAGLLKIQFPDGGSFACFQGEKNRLLATKTNEASFEPGGDIEIEVDDLAASRVTTCYVSDTKQLNFVDLQETIAVNVAALVAIFVGLRLFTYLSLRFVTLKTR